MQKPIATIHKATSSHPILWGSLVFVLGSGCELLVTQKLLGTTILDLILRRAGLIPHGKAAVFFYHTLALYVGLVFLAVLVHLIARMMKSKGKFIKFLTLLFFVTGIVSLISTVVTLIVQDQPGMFWLSVTVSVLSFFLYIGVVREAYKISWGHAVLAGGIPVALTFLLVGV